MKIRTLAMIGTIGILTLTGCRSKPMMIQEPMPFMVTHPISENVAREAIINAAINKKWQLLENTAGQVTLCYPHQMHPRYQAYHAVVRVEYDSKTYRIVYVRDKGLKKGNCSIFTDKQCIHRTYNRWVASLDLQIQKEIQKISL